MSLDASLFKYTEEQEWRVLTAVEMGQRNHELVATELVTSIAGLRGTVHHILQSLLRNRLVSHEGKPYDGYQLTKNGYDFLALRALVKRGTISHLGPLIGQGKEADVYVAYNAEEKPVIIKFHRIGRVSFRKAKDTRDYLNKKHTSSWLYLSRLSAQREFQNMEGLYALKFPVPEAIDHNRHCVVMSRIEGNLLNNISALTNPERVFNEIIDLCVNLLKIGVVHADCTQFNIIINEKDEQITLIDFPQCLKHTDPEAEEKFNHDLNELRKFFELRFNLEIESIPQFKDFLDEIIPVDIIGKGKPIEEEEEDGKDEDKRIIEKVSKENKLKRKPKKSKETKTMTKLRLEVKAFQ
jgi:RIO kinase 2